MNKKTTSIVPVASPWHNSLNIIHSTQSTNDDLKILAKQGAAEGTAMLAFSQTGGRGRMGRSFYAPPGLGMYLSVLFRPACPPTQIMHLTCAVAVAVCDSIEECTGLRPKIKWTNDLIFGVRKLGGILTELSVDPVNGLTEYVIVGIGINCLHKIEDFPPELQNMATSLHLSGCPDISPEILARHLHNRLYRIRCDLLTQKHAIMNSYRADCMTLGRQVMLCRGDERCYGTAINVDADGQLVVDFQDGHREAVSSGEISIRGMYGYI